MADRWLRIVRVLFAGLLLLVGAALIVYLRLTNLDLPAGRLFVAYWPQWCAAIVFLLAGALMFGREGEDG